MYALVISSLLLVVSAIVSLLLIASLWVISKRRQYRARLGTDKTSIAFFHPYCNDGGGGERVLWCIIDTLIKADHDNKLQIVVYSGDNATPEQILAKAQSRFGITIDARKVDFVFLRKRYYVEASRYPRFTMLGQSLGSIILALEALDKFTPHIFFDTMGYAFTFPVFSWLAGATIVCYVHYPTISTDMLDVVASGSSTFNNNADVAKSVLKTRAKIWYYRFFALLYRLMGMHSHLVIVNSSWTGQHIRDIWRRSDIQCIFPPCDTTNLQSIPLDNRQQLVISIGQFRPEKNHPLQLNAFDKFLHKFPQHKNVRLVMIGGVREGNDGDVSIVNRLKEEIKRRNLEKFVEVKVNIPKSELLEYLKNAYVGLHTMANEHFGISIVELMAAGVVPIVHNSGGPKLDIVVPYQGQTTGLLAITEEEYADSLDWAFSNKDKVEEMRKAARQSVTKFSDETFSSQVLRVLSSLPQLKSILCN